MTMKLLVILVMLNLISFICNHPLKERGFDYQIRLHPSDHVTNETGTGFVHIAPNHGLEDFEVGKKYGFR